MELGIVAPIMAAIALAISIFGMVHPAKRQVEVISFFL